MAVLTWLSCPLLQSDNRWLPLPLGLDWCSNTSSKNNFANPGETVPGICCWHSLFIAFPGNGAANFQQAIEETHSFDNSRLTTNRSYAAMLLADPVRPFTQYHRFQHPRLLSRRMASCIHQRCSPTTADAPTNAAEQHQALFRRCCWSSAGRR